jgi:hypothetical protein
VGPLSIEEVLAEEAEQIQAETRREFVITLKALATNQDFQSQRADKDADTRSGKNEKAQWVENRKAFYRSLNKLDRAALCCSGGGIRSATFCLGVIQALAAYDVTSPPPPPRSKAKAAGPEAKPSKQASGREPTEAKQPKHGTAPENSLLCRFHYLSTVSGGGYIGSWLSAWRTRDDFPTILHSLTGRPDGADVEPPEISWLRAYSNYLTPRVGIDSADSWTGVAIYLRNLLLNWLVIIPAICLALLVLKFAATFAVWTARDGDQWPWLILIGLVGVACLVAALAFTTAHRPTRREAPMTPPSARAGNVTQATFLKRNLVWSVVSAILITSLFTSSLGVLWIKNSGKEWVLGSTAIAGLLIYAAGWLAGRPLRPRCRDFVRWAGSGLVYGAAIGFGGYLFSLLEPYCPDCRISLTHAVLNLLVPMIFGMPWVLMSQMLAETVFIGLTSYEANSDSDREWLGRAAGWVAASAIVWAIVALLTLAGGYFVEASIAKLGPVVASVGGVAGIITALLGKSAQTPAKPQRDKQSTTSKIFGIVLAIAGPVFAAALIVVLSIALDELLLGGSLIEGLRMHTFSTQYVFFWLLIGSAVAAFIAWLASKNVNINRFSLHAVYRNRLIRAYLGASRQKRDPDHFTGFDPEDNLHFAKLWPPRPSPGGSRFYGLFHVVNMALNVVSTKRLAWQERKAESFTVSPLHSGSAYKGFRPSGEYGDRPGRGGITLGTAMAISGAAVSPNMGYHSSPSISLLLALFNVRLGWWLGNPGKEGEAAYKTDGPSIAIGPLAEETFGLTTDDRPYVYLSDGGHFENLGLYEMVRRRCRFIVVIDAGCDPKFTFEDLGNAVRKIYVDLGIRIRFDDLQIMRNRPSDRAMRRMCEELNDDPCESIPYCAIGMIDYESADGSEPGCANGHVLYIKPAFHGTEGAGIQSYAAAHPEFPHESTGDQWFSESQFESYRSLGMDIANDILGHEIVMGSGQTLHHALSSLANPLRA